MEERENDIQSLCKQVLEIEINFYDNPNGGYESSCPFCHAERIKGGGGSMCYKMSELNHEQNCAYLIAKDLSTNLKQRV